MAVCVSGLLSLPDDLLLLLPEHMTSLEDVVTLSQSCRKLRSCFQSVPPKVLLRLAAAPTNVLFHFSPEVLLAMVGRQLGNWARISDKNEAKLVSQAQFGVTGLLRLALDHCGLTLDRIWLFYRRRIESLDPLVVIIDQCVGEQWYEPEYWDGGRDGASSVSLHPQSTLYHFAIYGEIFGPDFESYISSEIPHPRSLALQTRLEIIKYCVPDIWIYYSIEGGAQSRRPTDSRLLIQCTGPYADSDDDSGNHNLSLVWTMQSLHWKSFWRSMRAKAGIEEFAKTVDEPTWPEAPRLWRQRLLENAMMLVPFEERWEEKFRRWRDDIASMQKPPDLIQIGRRITCDFPYLLGDLQMVGQEWLNTSYIVPARRG